MNINQQIEFLAAAANPFPLKAAFTEVEGKGYECKMCGAKVKDQNAATDHLLMKHREMEGGGPGSGRHPEGAIRAPYGEYGRIANNRRPGETPAQTLKRVKKEQGEIDAREFSEGRRKKLAKSGKALPGGGFPIVNRQDLANAKRAIGRAKNPAVARRHINERAKALGAKPIGAQIEFQPSMRLRMPKTAGMGTTTQNPQYTGGTPPLQAFSVKQRGLAHTAGFRKGSGVGKGCSSHGFHRGSGYESKARHMGHVLPLSAAADVPIRQRPINRRKKGYSFRGYQGVV